MTEKKEVWTVYFTENMVNGKFYYGVHRTSNPEDDYLGSGRWLTASVAKYGAANFLKTVLAVTSSGKKALALEKKYVEPWLGNGRSNSPEDTRPKFLTVLTSGLSRCPLKAVIAGPNPATVTKVFNGE